LGGGAACTKVDSDVSRAKFSENMADIVKGRDRGYFGYREMIEDATVREPRSPRYQYKQPAWVSNYLVTRAIRGLGGTAWPNVDYMAGSVDRLLYVLRYDPVPIVRADACSQLARIARRISVKPVDPYPYVELADEQIQQVSQDLFKLKQRLDGGERIKQSLVIDLLDTFETLYPTQKLLAVQMMRALSSAPVIQAPDGPLRDTVNRVVPSLARRCISISLAQLACGSVYRSNRPPDDAPVVRARAIEVLTALGDPVGVRAAVIRIWDEDYPAERDASVRMRLLGYLGKFGGPFAFEAALRRLENDLPSVRFHAQAALLTMTGTKIDAKTKAWQAWRAKNPRWQTSSDDPSQDPSERRPAPGTEPAAQPDK